MAKLVPTVLSVKARNWRKNDDFAEEADQAFVEVKSSVRSRDNFTCRFCGFGKMPQNLYMQVHHLNDDHGDNSKGNLITTCMHDHAVFHIGFWGGNRGLGREGTIIFLPEIEQYRLSHISRTILVAKRWADKILKNTNLDDEKKKNEARKIKEAAQSLFDRLQSRSAEAENRIGTSDPNDLANVLLELARTSPDTYDQRNDMLKHFRLLLAGHHCKPEAPGIDVMPEIVDSWMEKGGPYSGLLPSTWLGMLNRYVKF